MIVRESVVHDHSIRNQLVHLTRTRVSYLDTPLARMYACPVEMEARSPRLRGYRVFWEVQGGHNRGQRLLVFNRVLQTPVFSSRSFSSILWFQDQMNTSRNPGLLITQPASDAATSEAGMSFGIPNPHFRLGASGMPVRLLSHG